MITGRNSGYAYITASTNRELLRKLRSIYRVVEKSPRGKLIGANKSPYSKHRHYSEQYHNGQQFDQRKPGEIPFLVYTHEKWVTENVRLGSQNIKKNHLLIELIEYITLTYKGLH